MNKSVSYIKSLAIDEVVTGSLQGMPFSETGTRRICLHDTPEAPMHVMTIEVEANAAYPPHRHVDGTEVIFILKGRMDVLIWNDGIDNIPQCIHLNPELFMSPIIVIPIGIVHMTKPYTRTMYVEIKPGPFKKENLELVPVEKVKMI